MPFDPITGGIGSIIGGGLGNLFGGWNNPAKEGMGYLDQIPGQAGQYLNPYIKNGLGMMPGLNDQYGKLTSNPGGFLNDIGGSYQQSPGFQFALQQALGGANQASAAGGMAGSPQSQQQNMGVATGLASQDYNNWMQNALGLYGRGLSGQEGMYNTGFNASKSMSDMIAQMLAAKSGLSYAGQNAENMNRGGMFGGIGGGLGSLIGFM